MDSLSKNLNPSAPVSKISAIIPTYNRAHKVCCAIRSVLDQSFPPCEIIVVDDGSNDGSLEMLHEKFGNQVTLIKHEQNQGISAARRTGYRAARGEWVAYLDSDDLWPHDALEKLVEQALMVDPQTVVISGDMRIDNKKDEPRSHFQEHGVYLDGPVCPVDCRDVVFPQMLPYFQSSLILRSALKATNAFEEGLRIGEDTLVFGRLAVHGNFIMIPAITCHQDRSGVGELSLHQDEIGNPHFPMSRVLLLRALNEEGRPTFRTFEYAGWVREWIRRQLSSGIVVGPRALMEQFRYRVQLKSLAFVGYVMLRNAAIFARVGHLGIGPRLGVSSVKPQAESSPIGLD